MKHSVLLSLLPAIAGLCAAAAAAAPDPEVFESKGKDRNYAGVFPEKVKTIAVVTVGSYPSPATVKRAAALLRKAGYKVKIYPNALRPREKNDVGHYATMPAKYRIQDFEAAWKDMENDMIICTRGGAGTEEVADGADWAKLPKRPELYFQGYSGITQILCALNAKGYGRPVAGPNLSSLLSLDKSIIPHMKNMYNGKEVGPFKLKTLVPGNCSGKVFVGLMSRFIKVGKAGYKVDIKGRIVFIESVFCKADKVRAELTELCKLNFLDGAAGIVFCHFTRGDKNGCHPPDPERVRAEIQSAGISGLPVRSSSQKSRHRLFPECRYHRRRSDLSRSRKRRMTEVRAGNQTYKSYRSYRSYEKLTPGSRSSGFCRCAEDRLFP
ncbi:MAG: LD-carboxypeptidase [Lentisphaeria bacterium]|nr:LD-carboxypeptidase [Lentisphaeria bacterium]